MRRNKSKIVKQKEVLDNYALIDKELVVKDQIYYIPTFRRQKIKNYLDYIKETKSEYEKLKKKETIFHKSIRYLCGGLTGVMYCLAAYFTTSQEFILLGLSSASPLFLPLFITCSLAEGLGFFLMENSSLMKQMKMGVWADIEAKQKELSDKLELEKYRLECEILNIKSDKKFEEALNIKLEEYQRFNIDRDKNNSSRAIVEEIQSLKCQLGLVVQENEKPFSWKTIKYKFRKLFRPALYLLLGSGIVLYFSDGVDGIMTCFDFAKTSFHMHTTITFTVTAVAVAVLLGLMQSVFYWSFDGGYIRREFGLSCKQLRENAKDLLTSLNDLDILLNKYKDEDIEISLDKLEKLFIKLTNEKACFEQSICKVDGFFERRKDFKSVKSLKYTGYTLGFCINAAAGFFCGKMLLASFVILGISSPPGLAVLLFVGIVCALGRVLSYSFLERKKFGELFFGSKKRKETFKQKKLEIDKSYYKTKLALFDAKNLKIKNQLAINARGIDIAS